MHQLNQIHLKADKIQQKTRAPVPFGLMSQTSFVSEINAASCPNIETHSNVAQTYTSVAVKRSAFFEKSKGAWDCSA